MSQADIPLYPLFEIDASANKFVWPDAKSSFWSSVHEEVQQHLSRLAEQIQQECPEVRVAAGRTSGQSFFLFSYHTFALPNDEVDPVVAGITVVAAGDDVRIDADISGEQEGDIIASLPQTVVQHSKDKLIDAARDSASKLSESAKAVIAALGDPGRVIK